MLTCIVRYMLRFGSRRRRDMTTQSTPTSTPQRARQLALQRASHATLTTYRQNLAAMVPSRTRAFQTTTYQRPIGDPYNTQPSRRFFL
jgi:hypothetical protein